MAPDSDSEYDLSLEDQQLLVSLVEDTPFDPAGSPHDAPSSLPGSSQPTAALVGVGRTNSINAFVHKIQPQSTPSVIPAHDIRYPDRRCNISSLSGFKSPD